MDQLRNLNIDLATIVYFLDQFRLRLFSQLIKDISTVLQKLHRYFDGTIVPTFFLPLLPISSVIFSLILDQLVVILAAVKSTILPLAIIAGLSLQYCHKLTNIFA